MNHSSQQQGSGSAGVFGDGNPRTRSNNLPSIDIKSASYTPELKALWAAVHGFPARNPAHVLEERLQKDKIEPSVLAQLAQTHSLAALLYNNASRNLQDGTYLSSGLNDIFSGYFYRNLSRQVNINRVMAGLLKRFDGDDLAVIPLKGIFLAGKFYRFPAQRPMDDVDILVRPGDSARAESMALEQGFRHILPSGEQERYRSEVHHMAPLRHEKTGFNLEIHTRLGESGSPYRVETEALFDRSRPGFLLGIPVRQLLPEDFFIHLAVHMLSHVRNRLLQVADLRLFFDQCDFSLSSPHFTGLAEDAGVLTQVYFAACLALPGLVGFDDDRDLSAQITGKLDAGRISWELQNGAMLSRRQWASDETTDRLGMPPLTAVVYRFGKGSGTRAKLLAIHLARRAFPGAAYLEERYDLEKASALKVAAVVLLRPLLLVRSLLRARR